MWVTVGIHIHTDYNINNNKITTWNLFSAVKCLMIARFRIFFTLSQISGKLVDPEVFPRITDRGWWNPRFETQRNPLKSVLNVEYINVLKHFKRAINININLVFVSFITFRVSELWPQTINLNVCTCCGRDAKLTIR